jgi:hypothetical protein
MAMVTNYVTMKTLSADTRGRLDDADLNGPTDARGTSVQIISLMGAPFQVTRHVKHRSTRRRWLVRAWRDWVVLARPVTSRRSPGRSCGCRRAADGRAWMA